MAKTNWQDPKTGEIISPQISGLQEAVGKLEGSINIDIVAETDIPLSEVFISNDDRCRIYQAPEGKRNWIISPAPIIKKNGVIITDDFEIDYGGAAVVFTVPILPSDTLTADATYTKKVDGKQLSTNDYSNEEKQKNQENEDNIIDLAGVGRVDETVVGNSKKIGPLESLLTRIKDSIVDAINSLLEDFNTHKAENTMRNIIFDGTTRFYAHRGLSAYYPENTLYAIKRASSYGFYGVEIDIQPTKDGEIILMHDNTVDRTTNGTGNVADLNYSYISGLKIDGGNGLDVVPNHEHFPHIPTELYVPKFEEVVKECKRSNLSMQIELKGNGFTNLNLDKVVDIVDRYNMRNKVLFISFELNYLEYLRTKSDDLMLLYIVNQVTPSIIATVKGLKNAGVSASYDLNSLNVESVINDCHNMGIPIGFWTVNDIETVRTLVDKGCDFIATDKIKGSKIIKSTREYTLSTNIAEANNQLINMTPYGGDDCTLTFSPGEIMLKHAVPFDGATDLSSGRSVFSVYDGGIKNYYVATRSDQTGSIRLFIHDRATGNVIDHTNIPRGLWFSLICFNNDLG